MNTYPLAIVGVAGWSIIVGAAIAYGKRSRAIDFDSRRLSGLNHLGHNTTQHKGNH